MEQKIVLGVTGGIAAYKSLDLVKKLREGGIEVFVVMTPTAAKIVDPKEFEKASGNKVFQELFKKDFDYREILRKRKVEHIELAQSASLIVIAPATANVIAKLAAGIADDYLTTIVLAATCPIILCPSMNVYMWHHPAAQKNIETVKSYGYHIIDPDSGMLACGYEGQGRLASIETIHQEILTYLRRAKSLKGKKIIVTSGGTKEPIDDVRFITNKSSGKMGVAIAEESWLRGADVTLLRSRTSVKPRYTIKEKVFETADELEKLLLKEIPSFDICIHAAAVSDFSVKKTKGKLSSDKKYSLTLSPRKKILDALKKVNPKIFLVAFKAEPPDQELIEKAKKRMKESAADMIVGNRISAFGSDTNEIWIITKNIVKHTGVKSKKEIAEKIIDEISIRTG